MMKASHITDERERESVDEVTAVKRNHAGGLLVAAADALAISNVIGAEIEHYQILEAALKVKEAQKCCGLECFVEDFSEPVYGGEHSLDVFGDNVVQEPITDVTVSKYTNANNCFSPELVTEEELADLKRNYDGVNYSGQEKKGFGGCFARKSGDAHKLHVDSGFQDHISNIAEILSSDCNLGSEVSSYWKSVELLKEKAPDVFKKYAEGMESGCQGTSCHIQDATCDGYTFYNKLKNSKADALNSSAKFQKAYSVINIEELKIDVEATEFDTQAVPDETGKEGDTDYEEDICFHASSGHSSGFVEGYIISDANFQVPSYEDSPNKWKIPSSYTDDSKVMHKTDIFRLSSLDSLKPFSSRWYGGWTASGKEGDIEHEKDICFHASSGHSHGFVEGYILSNANVWVPNYEDCTNKSKIPRSCRMIQKLCIKLIFLC